MIPRANTNHMGESAVENWQVAPRQEDVGDLLGFLGLIALAEIDHLLEGSLELSFEVCVGIEQRVGRAASVGCGFVLSMLIGSRGSLSNSLLAGLDL